MYSKCLQKMSPKNEGFKEVETLQKIHLMSQLSYPLPRPHDYEEPQASRWVSITLRPHDDNPFTNEKEEKEKIFTCTKSFKGHVYTIIGKESNNKPNYEKNYPSEQIIPEYTLENDTYHYHILVKFNYTYKPTRKQAIIKEFKQLFPDNIIDTPSVHVRFSNPKARNAIGYTCKDGNWCFDGDVTKEFIENTLKIYSKEHKHNGPKAKTYRVCKKIPDVFEVLLEFCLNENIKHCNYNPPQTDDLDMIICDKVVLFVKDNKKFIDAEYLTKYFRRETGNLADADTDKIEKLAKYIIYSIDEFEQTIVSNRYVAYDNGDILIDGLESKILSPEEATQVLQKYTPLRTYEEDPTTDFKHPEFFYTLLEQTKQTDKVMELLRYYIAGDNNKSVLSYQLMGQSNTGKSTIIDFITSHFGIHAKKLTNEGKFTFADSANHLLRWSDEINLYQLYRSGELSEILLAILDRKPTQAPIKHKNQAIISPGLLLSATNPERDNPNFTIHKNNYDTKTFKPLNNRVVKLGLEHPFPDGKVDNSDIIVAETPYAVYVVAMKTKMSNSPTDPE